MRTLEIRTELEQTVRRGAELLDQERPGWWTEIQLETLEMRSCGNCILGQLYGGPRTRDPYGKGLSALGLDPYADFPEDFRYGFDILGPLGNEPASYDELQELWEAAIRERQELHA